MTTNHLAAFEHCLSDGPAVDVVTWRRCRLLESGFAPELAGQLASTPSVDLHALLQLVDRGCPPELAARILSPLATSTSGPAASGAVAFGEAPSGKAPPGTAPKGTAPPSLAPDAPAGAP